MTSKVPVEICGYRNQLRYIVDFQTGIAEFRMISVPNDNHRDDDFLDWEGVVDENDCPF